MDNLWILVISVCVSFFTAYLLIPIFIRFMNATSIVGYDIMKNDNKLVADMGGPGVIAGLLAGIFTYIGFEVFIQSDGLPDLAFVLASLNTILVITLIGIFDSLTSKMKDREGKDLFERLKRKGIPSWTYFFIPLPAAVPLMAVSAGYHFMVLPFLGRVDLGIFYPLVVIPLAVLCCSNATNFLAGFNGLEAGMGFVLNFSLGIYALIHGKTSAAAIAICFSFALLAFLKYNWYPAKVFPGDLNHTIGAVVVCVTVLGNMERFAILCFTPWIVEAFLKALSGFKAESFGVLQIDGTLKPKNNKLRSLTHLIMRLGSFKEWQVSTILIILEIIICLTSFVTTSTLPI